MLEFYLISNSFYTFFGNKLLYKNINAIKKNRILYILIIFSNIVRTSTALSKKILNDYESDVST